MENQNSETPKTKKFFDSPGKKKRVVITILAILLLTGFIGRGLVLGAWTWGNRGLGFWGSGAITGGAISGVAIAAKDFEPLGIVFVEDISGTRRNGYGTTYDALMKEAARKGADAIINVNVSSTRSFFKSTWSGSALAIKYLDTVSADGAVIGPLGIVSDIANAATNTVLTVRGFKRGWF